MLLAPEGPVRPNVGLGAFFERRQYRLVLDRLRHLARRSLLLHDVDAGGVAIAFHAEAAGITRKPRILERNIIERAQAVPALAALEPVTKAPVLRARSG